MKHLAPLQPDQHTGVTDRQTTDRPQARQG
jgi:hypothetical protein